MRISTEIINSIEAHRPHQPATSACPSTKASLERRNRYGLVRHMYDAIDDQLINDPRSRGAY